MPNDHMHLAWLVVGLELGLTQPVRRYTWSAKSLVYVGSAAATGAGVTCGCRLHVWRQAWSALFPECTAAITVAHTLRVYMLMPEGWGACSGGRPGVQCVPCSC